MQLPFVVADVNPHVLMTIGNFSHRAKPTKCKTTNDKNFIWRQTVCVLRRIWANQCLNSNWLIIPIYISSDKDCVCDNVNKIKSVGTPADVRNWHFIYFRKNVLNCQQNTMRMEIQRKELQNQNIEILKRAWIKTHFPFHNRNCYYGKKKLLYQQVNSFILKFQEIKNQFNRKNWSKLCF